LEPLLRGARSATGRAFLMLLLVAALCMPAHAVEPGEKLKDPVLEARARKLSQELRCVVCQNQSIDDSNAPLAHDLRVLVRERLSAGETDQQVLAFITARYGEFVLLRPPLGAHTLLLWLAPLLLLAGALIFLFRVRARVPAAGPEAVPPLSGAEQRRLAEILKDDAAN
jgi:cytochrome c-type biogenesis protein CcmH